MGQACLVPQILYWFDTLGNISKAITVLEIFLRLSQTRSVQCRGFVFARYGGAEGNTSPRAKKQSTGLFFAACAPPPCSIPPHLAQHHTNRLLAGAPGGAAIRSAAENCHRRDSFPPLNDQMGPNKKPAPTGAGFLFGGARQSLDEPSAVFSSMESIASTIGTVIVFLSPAKLNTSLKVPSS